MSESDAPVSGDKEQVVVVDRGAAAKNLSTEMGHVRFCNVLI